MNRLRLIAVVLLVAVVPVFAAEQGKISDLSFHVMNLQFRIEDIAGGSGDVAGVVLDLEVRETATEIHIDLAADVLFDFDKADLLPKAEGVLKQVADVIREKATREAEVRIEGHTDGKGSDSYNERLSQRRADSVRNWLVTKEGITNLNFATQGFGAKKPVAPNVKPDGTDDPEGRQKNRRVEIIVKK